MANKKSLTKSVAEAINVSQVKAKSVVESIISVISESLTSGEPVKIVNFGKFSVVDRKERKGRNPQNGEELIIPAKKAVKFVSGKALSEAVNSEWINETIEDEIDEIDEINDEIDEIEDAIEELQTSEDEDGNVTVNEVIEGEIEID